MRSSTSPPKPSRPSLSAQSMLHSQSSLILRSTPKARAKRLRRERSHLFLVDEVAPNAPNAGPLAPLAYAIGRLTGLSAEADNAIQLLRNGDEAYPAMLAAIDAAKKSVGMCSYIFRDD